MGIFEKIGFGNKRKVNTAQTTKQATDKNYYLVPVVYWAGAKAHHKLEVVETEKGKFFNEELFLLGLYRNNQEQNRGFNKIELAGSPTALTHQQYVELKSTFEEIKEEFAAYDNQMKVYQCIAYPSKGGVRKAPLAHFYQTTDFYPNFNKMKLDFLKAYKGRFHSVVFGPLTELSLSQHSAYVLGDKKTAADISKLVADYKKKK